jgi:hypothetical protein
MPGVDVRSVVNVPSSVILPAFSAGDYTSNSGAWTVIAGNVFNFQVIRNGRLITVVIELSATTVTGTPSELRLALPPGIVIDAFTEALGYCNPNGGANELMLVTLTTGATFIKFMRFTLANWIAGAGTTSVRAQFSFVKR